MAFVVAAVGRILQGTAGEAGHDFTDALELLEVGFHAPEAAAGEHRLRGAQRAGGKGETGQQRGQEQARHGVSPVGCTG